jgi:hypothetical protein
VTQHYRENKNIKISKIHKKNENGKTYITG